MVRSAALLPTALLLAGCSALPFGLGPAPEMAAGPEGLALTVEPGEASPGGSAVLTLYNASGAPVGYNLCIAALERIGGGLWVPALSSANACPQTQYMLGPGQQASAEALLPLGLAAGDYRFVTQVASSEDWPVAQVRSGSFTVRSADRD